MGGDFKRPSTERASLAARGDVAAVLPQESKFMHDSTRTPPEPWRSAQMSRVRRRGTAPEVTVAAALRLVGLRARRNVSGLPGTPDFAHKGLKIAIFVHGCFWHSHEGCAKANVPKRNREFWLQKLDSNRRRDRRNVRDLRSLGYKVHVIWECQAHRAYSILSRRIDRSNRTSQRSLKQAL
jgi:DNA mismatch endonuclease, patch repair protein